MSKIETKHKCIKDGIRDYHTYFEPNFDRYKFFMNFVFNSSLSTDDTDLMDALGKPRLEFNILEAYISRMRGEFSRQEPAFSVRQSDDGVEVDPQLITLIESHMRTILFDSNRDNMEYDIFTDVLGGGFSALKVYTDYANERSFNQNIYLRRVFDPTLVGFDRMATKSHKGDGKMAYELYPKRRSDFEKEFGVKYTENMSFTREVGGFNWSYTTTKGQEIVLVGDYYEKEEKYGKIVQLIDGRVMTVDEYEQNLERWRSQTDVLIQVPGIIGKPSKRKFTTIQHYIITGDDIINKEETDYKYLPIVFVDGNSVNLQYGDGPHRQMTRPYVYHARDIQKLKNFAGITLADELESMVTSRFMAYKESIPAEYKDAWLNPQRASILIANGFKDDDPNTPLPMPQVIPRSSAPPEIMSTFGVSDDITKAILGNYDSQQGNINDGRLSGVAIKSGAMQSNAASMPWNVGYMKAWNRVAEIILDLLPKYYTMPRSIPVQDTNGKRTYQKINGPGQPKMEYESTSLEVKVSAGVSFEIQRQEELDTLVSLMKISPAFAEIIGNTPEGCEMLLRNINIRGVDAFKTIVLPFFQKRAQEQQQQQQMAMQMNPIVIKQQEAKIKQEKNQMDYQIGQGKLEIDQQQSDTDRILALNKIGDNADKNELMEMKLQAEQARTAVEEIHNQYIRNKDHITHQHKKAMDILNLHHANEHKDRDRELKNQPPRGNENEIETNQRTN